jgi:hypothetical protein
LPGKRVSKMVKNHKCNIDTSKELMYLSYSKPA